MYGSLRIPSTHQSAGILATYSSELHKSDFGTDGRPP
ncbi:hypothetical protein CGMCC3_g7066 [Colletotrichum fructicola]|nr:uncharacterized protein CGMCC3_g7066 [Colletotrichum fructicola]KAE9576870.1 hypothetical protein CGMCC3_g7066 [Colletotrichum fructicola]